VHTAGAHHVGVAGLHHSLRQRRSLETQTPNFRYLWRHQKDMRTLSLAAYTP
jgi:hypothetical protein